MLTIGRIQEASISRSDKWHEGGDWSPLEWCGAMCGEAGESANFAKKLKRITDQIANNDKRMFGLEVPLEDLIPIYKEGVAHEAADSILYAIIVIGKMGYNAEDVIRKIFNQKSIEYNFPERI